ncbi:fatty acid-binding protein DegV [Metamycoplasma hyosynoviae]|uniref:DegV family protein n=1 Tax=Metamycoplasma hyosynoviae TaxID=29559 RepID=A0A063YAU2_9BACT|nr:DegV family protein [Metamycoplasma hyosynoviae]ASI54078.1 hypothetical protein MHSN_02740 [Metamycoplasma hyosynoviae]KDE41644.1 fatty acid-binding protein DegV [Metamycoplasma hyosynoviae]KDE41741.1 fatty acid-binding protein DegV [Metamycoplasma hyosynoviae]KDE42849.1 fatty acid-binding protein DegV [Metamycoplasma hyosynoviae]KDE43861.1 fatty acid-binding protein DegV [Metamycoplasma hyosynoviae]
MKIKIILDSCAGLDEKQAEEYGWTLLPLQANINGKNYFIGKELNCLQFAEIWNQNPKLCNASTSACSPGMVMEMVEKFSKEYDKIIIYSISVKLSSQIQLLKNLFAGNDKVFIVESKKLSYLIIYDLVQFENKIKAGASFEEACKVFDYIPQKTLLIPEFNDALVKGGRLSKSAAAIAKLLKIVPIIEFDKEGALVKYGIGRIFKKTLLNQIKKLKEMYQPLSDNSYLFLLHAAQEKIDDIANEIKTTLNIDNVYSMLLAPDIAIHTGVGAIAFGIHNLSAETKDQMLKFFKKH